MSRGRQLKTKKKEAYALAKQEEKARLQAQHEHDKRHPASYLKKLLMRIAIMPAE